MYKIELLKKQTVDIHSASAIDITSSAIDITSKYKEIVRDPSVLGCLRDCVGVGEIVLLIESARNLFSSGDL